MSRPRKVLLTGTSGFIGSHLAIHLEQRGYEVHHLVRPNNFSRLAAKNIHACSLSELPAVQNVFAEVRPDFLIHLASRAKPSRDLDDLDNQIQDTIIPTLTLSRAIPTDIKLALFIGSCEEYGNGPVPFLEEQSLRNISPYGWAKVSAYHAASMIAAQRGFPFAWIRPFLTFGPRQNSSQLIPSLIAGCLRNETISLSPGGQTRDFLYIEDLLPMFTRILEKYELAEGETINLCSGEPRSVRSVAEAIREICGSGNLNFGGLPYRVNEAMSFYGSRDKFDRLFGKPVFTPFNEALERTITTYRQAE